MEFRFWRYDSRTLGRVLSPQIWRLCLWVDKRMKNVLADEALDQLFREARTYAAWLDKPLTDDTLGRLYDLMKWGPTSANGAPARFVFLRSQEAKDRLRPALAPGNVDKTMTAPVTVIIAYDL